MTTADKFKRLADAVSRALTAYDEHEVRSKGNHNRVPLHDFDADIGKLEAVYKDLMGLKAGVPRQPYVNEPYHLHKEDGEYKETHESYGLISVSRVSSTGHRLFGSAVKHHAFIELSIYRGERTVSIFGERFCEDGRVPIVRIALSAAQFADAITNMNTSPGVPCTIDSVDGVRMDEPPEVAGELEALQWQFADGTAALLARTRATLKQIDAILEKKSLNKDDKEQIRGIAHDWVRHLDDRAPYMLKTMTEKAEKVVSRAKTEVEAFTTAVVHKLGLDVLAEKRRLGAGDGDDK